MKENLKAAVNEWRLHEWYRLTRKERALVAEPKLSDEVDEGIIRCAWVLSRAFYGTHHVPRCKVNAEYIEVIGCVGMATTDSNVLTRMVIAAHEAAVRVDISAGMRRLGIMLHARKRTNSNMTNHPTIEQAVELMRRGEECPVPVPFDGGTR